MAPEGSDRFEMNPTFSKSIAEGSRPHFRMAWWNWKVTTFVQKGCSDALDV
jgi:hypothetical protein